MLCVSVTAHVTMFILSAMFLRDVKTADNYVTINKMATNMWTGYTQPVRCLRYRIYIRTPLTYVHSHTLHGYLNVTYHVGLYTEGFSCNCNLARLLVKGGAIGVVANSLLERGEFGGS